MTETKLVNADVRPFLQAVSKPHRRINPCFMTGKGCVHTEHIDADLQQRDKGVVGFNVRPFQPNIETAHELSLRRFLKTHYSTSESSVEVGEADKVRRTGYVVCEKICRKVQASNFIIVDISAPNANVFYELGLAYGIDQKLLVIHHKRANEDKAEKTFDFGKAAAEWLKGGGCRCFGYTDLDPIKPGDFTLSSFLWTRSPEQQRPTTRLSPTIVLLSQSSGAFPGTTDSPTDAGAGNAEHPLGARDIHLGFETHVKAAVGVAIDNILENLEKLPSVPIMAEYLDLIDRLRTADQVKRGAGFEEVRQKIEQSFCTIIQTGGRLSDPSAYFWLGYCHALGKNVIPVTVVDEPDDAIDDLAFDLRALWHMSFARREPTRFGHELEETLRQMILSDFSEWSRKQFWDEMLGRRGKVSIFTGALHNEPIGREMIGDWDLRSASELASYFGSHQYRATIESPVYQMEQVLEGGNDVTRENYIAELEQMIKGKNCIVIASPDVNPLTEVLLGKLYGLDKKKWFKEAPTSTTHEPGSVLAFKEVEAPAADAVKMERTFYKQIQKDGPGHKKGELTRGFMGPGVSGPKLEGVFLSQRDKKSPFNVHAHLLIAQNPFDDGSQEKKHVVILNGVSGPATFALTHVLTGGTSSQFVAYPDGSPTFRSTDFRDAGDFAGRLLRDENELSKIFRAQLTEAEKHSLGSDGEASHPDRQAELGAMLAAAFNRLLEMEPLYTEERFRDKNLRPETRKLREQRPQDHELRRLNRLLLEDAFSADLRRYRFLPVSESERFLFQLNRDLEMKDRYRGIQYFFCVEVGPAHDSGAGSRDIFDWRRIVRWEREVRIKDFIFGAR